MSCELMDARVEASGYIEVDVPCDTGIPVSPFAPLPRTPSG